MWVIISECTGLSLILKLFGMVIKLTKMVWKYKEWKRRVVQCHDSTFWFNSCKDSNNALNHDKMWAGLLWYSFKFGISSLIRLHNFFFFCKIHIQTPSLLTNQFRCYLYGNTGAFGFLYSQVFFLLGLELLKVSAYSLYSWYPACQLSTELALGNYWSNKWVCLFSYRLSPAFEDYLFQNIRVIGLGRVVHFPIKT